MNKLLLALAFVFIPLTTFSQDPFSRGYYEKVSTYNNQYTRRQMFDIYKEWLNDAVGISFDKIEYNYTVYTQRDKQDYAWTIARGTSGYSNSYSVFHWIKIYISNGEFTIYYPNEGTSVSGTKRFIQSSRIGYEDWNTPFRDILNRFIAQSKRTLAIYNDNYGTTSLQQLSEWVDIILYHFTYVMIGHGLIGRVPFVER
jgi:hypothetical protein